MSEDTCDCECTNLPGCGCSKCTAPAVITELISGDPWDALFVYGDDNPDGFYGSGDVGDEPFLFHFTVYPGTDLPYYRISYNSDQDDDPDAVQILDEDGNIVTPDMVFDTPQNFTLQMDPTNTTQPGTYTGGVQVERGATAGGPWTPEQEKKAEIVITEQPGVVYVNHGRHDKLLAEIRPLSGDPVSVMFPICRVGPTTGGTPPVPIPATWQISSSIPGVTFTLHDQSVTLAPGTTYGPLFNNATVWLMMRVTHAALVPGQTYAGTITITTVGPAAHTDVRDVEIRKEVGTPMAHYFVIDNPSPVARGVGFALTVHAMKTADDTLDPYYAGGELRLNLTSMYSPPDVGSPVDFDSTGRWSGGSLYIPSFSFNGGAGGWPFLQVYDRLTGSYGTIQLNDAAFQVTINGGNDPERGVWFDVEIQAIHSDGSLWTDYAPSGNVNITMTPADPLDVMTPTFTSNAGWIAGKKTVSCKITGGAGMDAITIQADDVVDLWSGHAHGTIESIGFSVTANGGSPIIRGTAFNVVIQKLNADGTNNTTYVPATTVDIDYTDVDGLGDTMTPTSTNNTGWALGAKTVSCTASGGTGTPGDYAIDVTDATTGATGGTTGTIVYFGAVNHFNVSAAASGIRFQWVNITIQAVDVDDNPVLTYVPAGNVAITQSSPDIGDVITPSLTNNTGWSGGAKTVPVKIYGGTGIDVVRINAIDGVVSGFVNITFSNANIIIYYTDGANPFTEIPSGSIIPVSTGSAWRLDQDGYTVYLRWDTTDWRVSFNAYAWSTVYKNANGQSVGPADAFPTLVGSNVWGLTNVSAAFV